MYKIEIKNYGFKLTFGGVLDKNELQKWINESQALLKSTQDEFGVFVDMRTLHPLVRDAQMLMEEGQKEYKERGMQRSVVILDSAIMAMQFKRLAKDTGIYQWERYIDASTHNNWEELGVNWISDGIDPDRI